MTALDPKARDLAQGRNFAVLSAHRSKGRMLTHIVWIDAQGDELLVNTEVHRAKYKAVQRDPRVTVAIWDFDDPYRFVEVRGRVVRTTLGPEARAHIDALSQKYRGEDYKDSKITSERVILHIEPETLYWH